MVKHLTFNQGNVGSNPIVFIKNKKKEGMKMKFKKCSYTSSTKKVWDAYWEKRFEERKKQLTIKK